MKDDFFDNERQDIEENKEIDTENEKNGVAWDSCDGEQCQKETQKELEADEKILPSEGPSNEEKENTVTEEEEAPCEKEECACEEPRTGSDIDLDEKKIGEQSSCSYAPPHYTPNFSHESLDSTNTAKPKKGRKGAIISAIVAAVLAVVILLGAVLPIVIINLGVLAFRGLGALGEILTDGFSIQIIDGEIYDDEETEPIRNEGLDEDMNVIKNDGSINVNEQPGSTGYDGDLSIAQVVELVADTVVEITTTNVVTDRFYGQYVTSGAGSGVIITENGYIVTNYHVIEGAKTITVRLTNGSEFSARVMGTDPNTDIALLKIDAQGLPAAVLGNSADLVVGQEVVAIGNPLGSLGGTVTDGIISALDRTVVIDGHQMTLMQTNAAINPGNSGGGLFNRAGELIGIVNAKQSDTGIEGLGFAIPVDIVWKSIENMTGSKK